MTEAPYAFIQWKGTDACLDLHCTCGYHGHFDGEFAYALRCGSCGAVWVMPHDLALTPVTEAGWEPIEQDTDLPHDERRAETAVPVATVEDE